MRTAYLDCFAGISGDMFLGALLDAGVPLPVLEGAVAALDLHATLRVERVDRSGITATKVHVLEQGRLAEEAPDEHPHLRAHARDDVHEPPHPHEHPHEQAHSHDAAARHLHPHEQDHATGHEDEAQHAGHEHEHGHAHPHAPEPAQKHRHQPGDAPHGHGRSLSTIRELIAAAPLARGVQQRAIRTFELLGHSEAKIHNVPVEHIHFHEVGAVDAIVDIVASCAGIEHLLADGPVAWHSSPVNVGSGMVRCAHGLFPVPAPATADLLRGMPTYAAHVEKELVTPTGAALLRMLEPYFGPQPAMAIESIGYGAGTRNPHGFPNVLRLSLGNTVETARAPKLSAPVEHKAEHEAEHEIGTVAVLETALDDATPEVLAHAAERALAMGALDVMLMPVLMKKGRPGTLVTVLASPSDAAAMETLLLRETTTLGVRRREERRVCLHRHHASVDTPFGAIRIKIGTCKGDTWNAAPEFEDCRAAAVRYGAPVKQVMQAALAAYTLPPLR